MNEISVNIITNYNSYKYNNLKYYLKIFKDLKTTYHGHYAVTRSLIQGFDRNNFKFSYNNFRDNFDICWVLSDKISLKHVINLNKYKKLLAGPNISVLPTDDDKILMNKKIDLIIVPSAWVSNLYKNFTNKKISVWYAGVNENFWKPKINHNNRNSILIYFKHKNQSLLKKIINFLQNNNLTFEILKYGEYKINEYRKKLLNSRFAIFITNTESQGIALCEAWSMDVPTFVWNDKNDIENKFIKYGFTSNAPYLNLETGSEFKNFDELTSLINNSNKNQIKFSPRKWVLENMTDKICAKNAIRILKSLS